MQDGERAPGPSEGDQTRVTKDATTAEEAREPVATSTSGEEQTTKGTERSTVEDGQAKGDTAGEAKKEVYVAPAKKFASSLSVTKKFLSKAQAAQSSSASPSSASASAAAAAASASTTSSTTSANVQSAASSLATLSLSSGDRLKPVSNPVQRERTPTPTGLSAGGTTLSLGHPRLVTTRLNSPAPSQSTASHTPAAGWSKPAAPTIHTTPSVPPPSLQQQRQSTRAFLAGQGAARPPWAAGRPGGGPQAPPPMTSRDFPTAAEAASEKQRRAAALAAKQRLLEERAAAAAAKNAELLQSLDAFRGTHLDPNAHHWDEDLADDDDDFLDTTIEFADGTQYRVENVPEEEQPQQQPVEEVELDQINRAERFRDDFDRTYSRRSAAPGPADYQQRTLYNDKKGRLEPAPSAAATTQEKKAPSPGPAAASAPAPPTERKFSAAPAENPWNKNKGPPVTPAPVIPRRESVTSPVAAPATAPVRTQPQQAEPVVDLEEQHAREMHAAAERAKVRRQEEEKARLEQIERAKQKAAEIEAKMKASAAPTTTTNTASAASVSSPTAAAPAAASKADVAPSWRDRAPSVTSAAPVPASETVTSKAEPRQILARPPSETAVKKATEEPSSWRATETPQVKIAQPSPTDKASPKKEKESWRTAKPETPTSPERSAANKDKEKEKRGKKGKGSSSKQVATLEDLMSRVMGAMHVSPQDTAEDPYSLVTADELPFDRQRGQRVKVPRSAKKGTRSGSAAEQPRSLEPIPVPSDFDRTADDRPLSPPPAWKVFPVRFTPRPARAPLSNRQRDKWEDTMLPKPVHAFSWFPHLAGTNIRRPLRDDVIFFSFFRAPTAVTPENAKDWVKLPTERWSRLTEHAAPEPVESQSLTDIDLEVIRDMVDRIDVTLAKTWEEREDLLRREREQERKGDVGIAAADANHEAAKAAAKADKEPEAATGEETFEATTAPDDADLFEVTPPVSRLSLSSRTRMNQPSLLNGARGEETRSLEKDPLAEAKSAWQSTESHSVLNLTQPSMWSAASAHAAPFAAPFIASTEKNSLQRIISGDADDFPVVDMPTSMADLQTDEHSPKRASAEQAQAGKEATLGAEAEAGVKSAPTSKSPVLTIPDFHRTFMSPTLTPSDTAPTSGGYSPSHFPAGPSPYATQQAYAHRQASPYQASTAYSPYQMYPPASASMYGAVGANRSSPYAPYAAAQSSMYAAGYPSSPFGSAGSPTSPGSAPGHGLGGYPSNVASSGYNPLGYPSPVPAPAEQRYHSMRSPSLSSAYGPPSSWAHHQHQQQPQPQPHNGMRSASHSSLYGGGGQHAYAAAVPVPQQQRASPAMYGATDPRAQAQMQARAMQQQQQQQQMAYMRSQQSPTRGQW